MEQDSKCRNNPLTYGQSMTKEARVPNGEKTVSSVNGDGKTRQLHVRKMITFFNPIHKNKLKMD